MGKVSIGEMVNSGATPIRAPGFIEPEREISFAEIVCPEGGPIAESKFAKHFCEKQMLHMPQEDRNRFQHLLPWQMINDILRLEMLDEKLLRVARDGRDIPPTLYRRTSGERDVVDARKLHDLLKQNASVAINQVQYLSPPVRRLATQMEVALGQKLNVNAYMTFGPGGAFAMHYDAHDVLVMQVHGTKHWFIYDEPAPSPIDYEKKTKPHERNVVFETVLHEGDVLYVPRGTYHRAAVTDTDSVHLTFGIHTAKGLDFIAWLRQQAENDELFRKDVIALAGADALADQERAFKARLGELVESFSLSDYIENWRRSRKPLDEFRLGPREELDDHTMLAPLLRFREAWHDSVAKKGKEPSVAGDRIVGVLIEKSFATVGELKAELRDVLDEDTIKSTLAELLDDCWIEVVR
jgi:hypothetical protein